MKKSKKLIKLNKDEPKTTRIIIPPEIRRQENPEFRGCTLELDYINLVEINSTEAFKKFVSEHGEVHSDPCFEILNPDHSVDHPNDGYLVIKNQYISFDEDSSEKGDQTQFLTMLDGLGSSEKRMFIASINSTYNISEFMLNRPGRFYYHFDFPSLGENECTEYLTHETNGLSKKTIQYAVMAMQNYNINYDGLAAIATELNHGNTIEDTLRDLNLDRQGNSSYDVGVTINGFEYGGVIEDSLETLQQERDRYTIRLYCATAMQRHAEKVSTGYIGPMVNFTVHKFKIEMDKKGNLVFPLDKSTVTEIYCPDGGVKLKRNPDDDDNYYLQLEDLKSVSMATLKPIRPARTAMYISK